MGHVEIEPSELRPQHTPAPPPELRPAPAVEAEPPRISSKSVLRSAGALYLSQVISIPVSIVVNLVAGKFLEPGDYGIFFTSDFLVSFIALFANGGLVLALIREPKAIGVKEYAEVFVYQLVVSIALGALIVTGTGTVARVFEINADVNELRHMLSLMRVVPVLQAFVTVPLVMMERNASYGRIAKISLIWSVLERVALIGFIVSGFHGYSYAYARIFGTALQVLFLARLSPWSPFAYLRYVIAHGWRGWRELSFGAMIQLRSLSNMLQTSVIPGVGNRLFDLPTVGLLAWSNNTAYALGQTLPQSVGRVIVGSSSRMSNDRAGYLKVAEQALSLCTIFCTTLLAVVASLLTELLTYAFKPQWLGAHVLFAWACVPMVQSVLLTVYDALVLARGKAFTTAVLNWATAGATFGLSIVFGKWMGPSGVIVGMIVANFIPMVVFHLITRREFPVRAGHCFFLPAFFGCLGGLASLYLKAFVVHGIVSLVLFAGVMFVSTVGIYLAFHSEDVSGLKNLLGVRFGRARA